MSGGPKITDAGLRWPYRQAAGVQYLAAGAAGPAARLGGPGAGFGCRAGGRRRSPITGIRRGAIRADQGGWRRRHLTTRGPRLEGRPGCGRACSLSSCSQPTATSAPPGRGRRSRAGTPSPLRRPESDAVLLDGAGGGRPAPAETGRGARAAQSGQTGRDGVHTKAMGHSLVGGARRARPAGSPGRQVEHCAHRHRVTWPAVRHGMLPGSVLLTRSPAQC